MKKVCVVNYVYGEKYQGFIPVYIISLAESYPEYDLRIYIDQKCTEQTSAALEQLSKYYSNFTIVEDYEEKSGFVGKAKQIQQIQRCQRWLFYDEAFDQYEAIYIGDIDLLICREDKPLYEQHCRHCDVCANPYSNISRAASAKNWEPKMIARNLVKFGLAQTAKYYFGKAEAGIKLSGLHFARTKDYFDKIRPIIDEAYGELNLLAEGKSKKYNLCSFNNEVFLRDLVLMAGMGDAPLSTGEPYNIETDANNPAYRPHHGIHLGIFRSPELVKAEEKVVGSDLYRRYYGQFVELKKLESYQAVQPYFTQHLNSLIAAVTEYYERYEGN